MKLHDLKPNPGSHKTSKRIGRGYGSGKGKTGGKGMGGQKARSGPNPYRTFEGGQNRLVRRLPFLRGRGFQNLWKVDYQVLNVSDFQDWDLGDEVNLEQLIEARVIHKSRPLKILGEGELTTRLTIQAHKFSDSARQKIEAAGGTIVELPWVRVRKSRAHGEKSLKRARKLALRAQQSGT